MQVVERVSLVWHSPFDQETDQVLLERLGRRLVLPPVDRLGGVMEDGPPAFNRKKRENPGDEGSTIAEKVLRLIHKHMPVLPPEAIAEDAPGLFFAQRGDDI